MEQQTTTQAASTLMVRSPVRIGVQCQFLDKLLKFKTDLCTSSACQISRYLFSRNMSIDVGFTKAIAKVDDACDRYGLSWLGWATLAALLRYNLACSISTCSSHCTSPGPAVANQDHEVSGLCVLFFPRFCCRSNRYGGPSTLLLVHDVVRVQVFHS